MALARAGGSPNGRFTIDASSPSAASTSGWRGRSFSFGVADAVTVLARTDSVSDAAATMIANEVDVAHPGILRRPANTIRDDTDLGSRLVTVAVPPLPLELVDEALERGARGRGRNRGRVYRRLHPQPARPLARPWRRRPFAATSGARSTMLIAATATLPAVE